MLHSRLYRSFFIALFVLLTGSLWAISSARFSGNAPTGEITLKAPPFVSIAKAEANQPATFADDEAGIAGYIKVNQTIDLSKVDDLCRNISEQNTDYLICSIDVLDYDENHSPTVYVHKDGWVMAYYRNSVPTSYIIDFRHYNGDTNLSTKLERVINRVTDKIGAASTKPTYYHFAYPNANKLTLIAELQTGATTDSFKVQLPADFSYFEQSWSAANFSSTNFAKIQLQLDEQDISPILVGEGWTYAQDRLAANMDSQEHTFSIVKVYDWRSEDKGFGGLAVVYKVP